MVRLHTDMGIEGVGFCRAKSEQLAPLLGKNPFDVYRAGERRMAGPFGAGSMPWWDLVGKILKKPVYALLAEGKPARSTTPVYDGSIYFSDLLPENEGKSLDLFKKEMDSGLKRGHRAFKIKIGRGGKWMPSEEGYQRDVAVLKLIRSHVGPEIQLAVDANDGLDLPQTKRLLSELPDFNFLFVEEMFPENVDQYHELKAFIKQNGWKTLIGDFEGVHALEQFAPWTGRKAVDIYQGDIHTFGVEGIISEAALAALDDAQVAPHNWGSLIGFYSQLHLGRVLKNFYMAEEDPLSTPALIADGFTIKDGRCSVPDSPGYGLVVDPDRAPKDIKVNFDLKA
jgi:L-alanine-DL-glutamate epimerase-like enolase superfamily enzyme